MTQPVLPTPDATPGLCICGRPLPVRRPPCSPATECSWPCALVRKGVFTLEQIQPWLASNREPLPKDAAA